MWFEISETVSAAIASGRAVVALESAVLTHGLPVEAALHAVDRQRRACEGAGAIPAVIGVYAGRLKVGLSAAECEALARHPGVAKASTWNLAAVVSKPGFAGTTVAATIRAAALAGIRVGATGGIGGVHRGIRWDVSADLSELASRQICLVCAGPKAILDVGATVEVLETIGVPLIGFHSDRVAGFLASTTEVPVAARIDSVDELAIVIRRHWDLGGAGVVVSRPLEGDRAIPDATLAGALETLGSGVHGGARTPADLARLQAELGPEAIAANQALLEANASLAGELAAMLART